MGCSKSLLYHAISKVASDTLVTDVYYCLLCTQFQRKGSCVCRYCSTKQGLRIRGANGEEPSKGLCSTDGQLGGPEQTVRRRKSLRNFDTRRVDIYCFELAPKTLTCFTSFRSRLSRILSRTHSISLQSLMTWTAMACAFGSHRRPPSAKVARGRPRPQKKGC